MSLRFRINVLITFLFVTILALGAVLVIHNAKRAVLEETQSTARLALQLLEVAYGSSDAGSEPLRARLRHQMAGLDSARHLHVALIEGDGEQPLADLRPAADSGAPGWFARLVAPGAIEFRRTVTNVAGAPAELLVRADPADEIAESWEDARTVLGLVLVFALIANGLVYFTIGRWVRPVERIVAALDRIEQGEYKARLPAFHLPELHAVADKVNHMAGVLERSREENRYLRQRSLAIQEAERRALARELHDELGQSISAIEAVAVSIEQAGTRDSQAAAAAGTIASISSQMYAVVRGMMRRLRPVVLDEFGLERALQELADGWNERHADAFCRLTTAGALAAVPDAIAIHVYRIVQEALTNASRHSNAGEVAVHVERRCVAGADTLAVEIRDDGVGFDAGTPHDGLGLRGMRERVDALRGTFEIGSGAGQGVAIAAVIPLEARA